MSMLELHEVSETDAAQPATWADRPVLTAGDLRTLTATGASSLARRTVTAATAGALALAGAVTGVFCAYLAAIGFFRTNQLDGLSVLSFIPVANLLLILVGMPLVAAIASWLLAGRQPPAIGRQPLE